MSDLKLQNIYREIEDLKSIDGVDLTIIGESTLGNPIYAVHIGCYDCPQIIIEASIHAREYITSLVLIEQIKYLNRKIEGFGIYAIPLVNPDGVKLVLEGVQNFPQERKDFLLKVNNFNKNFSLWKANANAVDLNVNFDALWGGGMQNIRYPAPANFIGYNPNSEIEVINLINFTKKINPVLNLSYHTKGEVIYYGFETLSKEQIQRDEKIAQDLASYLNYIPVKTYKSTGGYSDWVSYNYGIPSFTIEMGKDNLKHPINITALPNIFEQVKNLPIIAYEAITRFI
jgi:g-D-glutamyl-meso-diaminopimelate peptidase